MEPSGNKSTGKAYIQVLVVYSGSPNFGIERSRNIPRPDPEKRWQFWKNMQTQFSSQDGFMAVGNADRHASDHIPHASPRAQPPMVWNWMEMRQPVGCPIAPFQVGEIGPHRRSYPSLHNLNHAALLSNGETCGVGDGRYDNVLGPAEPVW